MQVRAVEFQKYKRLSVVQFLTAQQNSFEYISGPSAIRDDLIQIKEVSVSGNVNSLLVFNQSDKYAFFMDGDILIGAKQNRVLNTSVLLAPNSKTTLPVSCVEQGRWSHISAKFMDSEYITPQKIRANKSRNVSVNLRSRSKFDASQSEVWKNVEDYQVMYNVNSPTMNLSDVYEKEKKSFDEFIKNFNLNKNANGLALLVDQKLFNIEVFNRTDIYSEYFPKILKSTAMEVIHLAKKENNLTETEAIYKTQEMFEKIDTIEKTKHKGVAAGDEQRFDSLEMTGFELSFRDHLIHLTALNIEGSKDVDRYDHRWDRIQ
ncbi:MAG: DUF6569 family protein [Ignavibacterium sp.]|jgi:hypothetical protein|nr:DUF6569 family protein [Ignavibacterium sp.]